MTPETVKVYSKSSCSYTAAKGSDNIITRKTVFRHLKEHRNPSVHDLHDDILTANEELSCYLHSVTGYIILPQKTVFDI